MPADGAEFIDTNIVAYALIESSKTETADAILSRGCVISVQVLNELTNICRRKFKMDWSRTEQLLRSVRVLSHSVALLDVGTHEIALGLSKRYNFSIYDANLVAAALKAGCTTLWSEDTQDGLLVEGQLTIRNPFLEGVARG